MTVTFHDNRIQTPPVPETPSGLRDQLALAIAPTVVAACSPNGYGNREWKPVKTIAATIYAIADACIEARNKGRS